MRFTVSREVLFEGLTRVSGALEKKPHSPFTTCVLLSVTSHQLRLVSTDLEMELSFQAPLTHVEEEGAVALPGKKLIDICKALEEVEELHCELEAQKWVVRAARSRFVLATLIGDQFPRMAIAEWERSSQITQSTLRRLFDLTSFAMAQQDVRYYLNGVCLIVDAHEVRAVATDGHRLATVSAKTPTGFESAFSCILPRKSILETQRFLQETEEPVSVAISAHFFRMTTDTLTFTTKLIEGKFPSYKRVIPEKPLYHAFAHRELLKQALLRVCALFSDKYWSVRLQFAPNRLRVVAVTPAKEEGEDEIAVAYEGPEMEIGVNAHYLIAFFNVVKSDTIRIAFSDPNREILFVPDEEGHDLTVHYVVMPLQL